MSFSRACFRPRDRTHNSCLADGFFATEPAGRPIGGIASSSFKIMDLLESIRGSRRLEEMGLKRND